VRIDNMELALSPTSPGMTVPQSAALCRFAEELGYRQAWMAEVAGPDAFVLAAAAAVHTERLELGVAVVPAFTRTPAALATAAASVSQALSGRTFALGVGASSEAIVSGWHGVAFERPRRRVEEMVEAVRTALGGGSDYQGSMVSMQRFKLASPPVGPVPILVGALRPGMLELAGAIADGVCLNLMPPEVVLRQLAAVRRGAEERRGGLPDDFGVMARLQVVVTDDVVGARHQLRQGMLGPYLAQPVYNRFLAWMGYPEEAAAIAAGWAARDREAVSRAVHDRLVDALALIGPARRVRDRLEEYAASGVTVAALSVAAGSSPEVEDTLTALAQ
jgi:probable F420-dependent oxidoreductase